MSASADPPRDPVPLRLQADEVQRVLATLHRSYAGQVKHGRMTELEATVSLLRMRAVRDTLRLFAEHEDAVRAALISAIRRQRESAELDALRADPAVGAVLEQFPDAQFRLGQDDYDDLGANT